MREILTASAQGEEDMQQIPPELLLFHSIPVIHSCYSILNSSMGWQQPSTLQALWQRIVFWQNEQRTSWEWAVMLFLGHLFCIMLLFFWPFLICSCLECCYEIERTTLWFLLLSGKGKRGQMVNLSLWLRFAFVWCEWRCCDTQCVLNHIFALMKSRFWEP